ncbi:MAG: phosphoribosyltransferase, partial [bacterium]|nr:phosphoribosyltransferase [bacterium]
ATGLTVKAAALTVRAERPGKMVLAVPVAASDSLTLLRPFFDEIICLESSETFFSVGQFYDQFESISDETAAKLFREGCGPIALN